MRMCMMQKSLSGLAAAVLTVAITMPTPVLARSERTKIGTLNCDISAGIGAIIASKKTVRCVFRPLNHGSHEVYVGTITKFGLDLGATNRGRMIWAVYAPSNRRHGALAGRYVGATAEATVGAGVGANVLVGGSHHTVTLQPLSVQEQTGFNVAAGVAGLTLRPAH